MSPSLFLSLSDDKLRQHDTLHARRNHALKKKKSRICLQQQKKEKLTQAQLMIHDLLVLRVI